MKTCKMNSPMRWAQFVSLDKDIQKEYAGNLIETYKVGYHNLAEMFGCSDYMARNYLVNELGFRFTRGSKTSKELRRAWEHFLDKPSKEEDPVEETVAEQAAEPVVPVAPVAPAAVQIRAQEEPSVQKEKKSMSMTNFTMVFQGDIDPSAIANSLLQIIGLSSRGRVEINCTMPA